MIRKRHDQDYLADNLVGGVGKSMTEREKIKDISYDV